MADKASSSRSREFTFLGPEPDWPLRPAAAADPEAGAACRHQAALGWGQCTNGEGQGEGSFKIIYKHITKFHYFCFADSSTQEYKSSRMACLPQRFSTVWGSPLHAGHQEHRRAQGPDEFLRGMLRIEWGFGIPDCRAEALTFFFDCFVFPLMFQKFVLAWGGGAGRLPSAPSLAELAACFHNALCTLPPPQSVGSSALAIL